MYEWTRRLGCFAAIVWFLLGVLTAASGLIVPGALMINLIVAIMFAVVSFLLWWRIRAVESVWSAIGAHEAMGPLLRVDATTSAAMLVLGVLLLMAATHRVINEGMSVFG
jgi:hypothetical protein